MDRWHYEKLCKMVWNIFPFIQFEFFDAYMSMRQVKIKASWSYKGRGLEYTETLSAEWFDKIGDKDYVTECVYRNIMDAILKAIEEENHD